MEEAAAGTDEMDSLENAVVEVQLNVEAEAMSLSSSYGKVFTQTSASGGKALIIWSRGTASKWIQKPSAADRIRVRARADLCGGGADMVVKVGGATVLERRVESTNWTTYEAAAGAATGSTQLTVSFTNDLKTSQCDRNLRIDKIEFLSSGAAAPAPAPAPMTEEELDASWSAAWTSGNHETLRSWFEANVAGPTVPLTGTHPGGTITTQAQADALVGKTVTGPLTVSGGTLHLRDFVINRAQLRITSGTISIKNARIDAQKGTAHAGYFEITGGSVDLYRVEILNGQDGLRTWTSGTVSGQYVYIHSVSDVVGGGNGHQDGVQQMGGALSLQRCFIDYRNATTSAVLIKPDSKNIPLSNFNDTFFQGGGYTIHIHDAYPRTISSVDFANNMFAGGYRTGLVSLWEINATVKNQMSSTPARVSPTGATILLKDGAKL